MCRVAKRELNKATRVTSKFPSSGFLRSNFYKVKKSYKSIVKTCSNKYFNKLNKEIEDGKIINWKQFKKLKSQKSSNIEFDGQEMNNFENFFSALYSD